MTLKNKKVNFLAIIGMMVAFGTFAFGTMTSKNSTDMLFYPNIDGTYSSTPLDPLLEGNQEEGWECLPASEKCAAEFSTPPTSSDQEPDGVIKTGRYVDHSQP